MEQQFLVVAPAAWNAGPLSAFPSQLTKKIVLQQTSVRTCVVNRTCGHVAPTVQAS